MSVLIKGMKMPINGNEIIIRIQPDGTILDQYGHHLSITAVYIPSHGRLIDADVLEKQMKNRKNMIGRPSDPDCLVMDATTVIPAEE